MAKINKKQMDELKNTVNSYLDQTEEIFRRLVSELNNSIFEHRTRINELGLRDQYNREYIKALNFLSWFSWDKLYSQSLIKEAKSKLYAELNYSQTDTVYGNLTQLNRDDDSIDIQYLFTGKHQEKVMSSNTLTVNTGKLYTVADKNNVCYTTNINPYVKEESKIVKHEYNEYVKAVVNTPHKYSKSVVYNVYKYLLDIIEKDKIASKYSNEV